jgi:hypothetical protein
MCERSLYWSKDSKSGRTLENAPLFTEGTYLYTVSTQKHTPAQDADHPENTLALVIESYNKKFEFVEAVTLMQEQDGEKQDEIFAYEKNNPELMR